MKTWIVENCNSGMVYLAKANTPEEAMQKVLKSVEFQKEYDMFCKNHAFVQEQLFVINGQREHELPPSLDQYKQSVKARQEFVMHSDVMFLKDLVNGWI